MAILVLKHIISLCVLTLGIKIFCPHCHFVENDAEVLFSC